MKPEHEPRIDAKKMREKLKGNDPLNRQDRDALLGLSLLSDVDGALNDRIAGHMQDQGIENLRDFATIAGIPLSAMNDLVQGHKTPAVKTLVALARALECPTHTLLYLLVPDAPGAPKRA